MRLSKHVKPHIVFGVAALVLSGIFAGIIIGPVFLYAQSSPGSAGTPFDPAQPQAEPDPFAELGERYDPLGVFNTPQPPRNFVEQTPAERAEMEKEKEKGAAEAAARAAEENRKALAEKFTCLTGFKINLNSCLAGLMNIVMWLAARTLWIAGVLLNITLHYTLNLNTLLEKLPIVDIGWKVLRDIANIVFIFITLWAGISITLGIGDRGKKAWGLLAQMVLVALFINFSLFITKAVVDASNIAALHFYSLIVDPEHEKDYDSGLSEAFLYGLKLGTLYNSKQLGAGGAIGVEQNLIGGALASSGKGPTFTNIILIGFFGSLFIVITAWVFFAAAIMFIYRAVTLIFLMILSPLAFVGLILPGASGMAHAWWSKLWSQAFFAPLYLALAYVVVKMVKTINSPAFQGAGASSTAGTGFAAALTGTGAGTVEIIFIFVILIGLMVACLVVAQSLGAKGSDMAMAGWEKIKGGAIGVAGATVRGTIKAPSTGIRAIGNVGQTRANVGRWMANSRLLQRIGVGNWARRRGASMETAGEEMHKRMAGARRWTNRIGNAVDVRHLEERAGQSWLGQTTIGKGIRAVTVGGLANLKIGDKSMEEAHKESEEQRTARHVINSITQVRNVENELRPLRKQQNTAQKGVHAAQVAQENARQELAQAQTPPPTPARQQEIDAAQAALTAAQAAPLSAQQQQRITDAQDNLRDATQDLATELADIASRQQPAIAVALQDLEQEQRVLAQNPTDAIQRDIVENMRQRLEQAQAGSPQDQSRIAAMRAAIPRTEQELAAAKATNASERQQALAPLQARLATAQISPPLTAAQQTAIGEAKTTLKTAETSLTQATTAMQAFQSAHGHDIEALTRRKSEAYAAVSPGEYVKYAPKADIIANMDFGDTPLSIYNAVIADEHRLNEHEKEEATNNFLHRINEVARRGGARTEQYHRDIITLQRNLNRFGARRGQIMSRLVPEVRRDIEQLEARRIEVQERLDRRRAQRMARRTTATPPSGTPPGGTSPQAGRNP